MSELTAATHLTRVPQPPQPPPPPPTPPTPPQTLTPLDPLTRWYTNHNCNPFADPRPSDVDWFSEAASDSDRDVNCFVTDLFDRSGSHPLATELEIWGLDDDDDVGDETGSNLGLGFGIESSELGEFISIPGSDSGVSGLRIVGLESESESDSGTIDDDVESNLITDSGIQSIWDNLLLVEQRNAFENSEDSAETNPTDGSGRAVEELSGFSTEEDEVPDGATRSLEWEILLTVNNFRRYADDDDVDIETAEYINTIFGQFVENASAMKGSPPAAISVVEDLPYVEFTMEELKREEVVCAVCKDCIASEDTVRSLPCCHYYHQDCIVPWLGIRNTCPVCRYELPTDDLDYERNKSERGGVAEEDSQLRFEFGFEQFV